MSNVYAPTAFYFQLSFDDGAGTVDAAFQEVSGISMETGLEEITEGGSNSFTHRVPGSVKYSNLVLKRGQVSKGSPLIDWCEQILEGSFDEPVKPKTILVQLLDKDATPLASWSFVNAWPVKWSISGLKSMNNEILIESLEFAYSYFDRF